MAIGRLRLKNHAYDFPPYRPPSEPRSLLLRLTRGCTWPKCTFCSMYRHICFERRPLDQVRADILAARGYYSDVTETVFIGDSNSLVIGTDDFVSILELLREYFPNIRRITSYARAKTLQKKPLHDLKRLRDAGLTRLHVGLETGNALLLEHIRKGATPDEMIAGSLKAKAAGFELSLYVLLGIGGEQRWQEHSRDTAAVLSRIDPHFIRVRTFHPQPGCELYEELRAGSFAKASPATVLREQRAIIANLEATSEYLSDHISNYLPVNGRLPADRPQMLQTIDEGLASLSSDERLRSRLARKDNLQQL